MKYAITTLSALLLSGTLALAQSSGGGTGGGAGGAGGGASGAGSAGGSAGAPSTASPQGKSGSAAGSPTTSPGVTAPSPADPATTGRGPGVNPANPQDLSRRSNPQDLTQPGGRNPQDQIAPGVPNIVTPEPR